MKNSPVVFQKIPLEGFIDTLITLFDKGALYIDLAGTPNEDQDMMSIFVRVEYIDEEHNEFTDDDGFTPGEEDIIETKLSDENLNQLI